jgi:hypothetical protein
MGIKKIIFSSGLSRQDWGSQAGHDLTIAGGCPTLLLTDTPGT